MNHSPKLRVLLTGPSHQTAMARTVRWVVDDGHDVWLLGRCRPQGVEAGTYHYIPSLAAGLYRILLPLLKLKLATVVFTFIGSVECRIVAWLIKPDLVHAHFLYKEAVACTLAKLHPLIVSVWGGVDINTPGQKNDWERSRLFAQVIRGTDAFIVEHPTLHQCVTALAKPTARVELLTLGIDTEVFKPDREKERQRWRKALSIGESDFVFLSSRGMFDLYRQTEILEAFAESRRHFNHRAILVFVRLKRGLNERHKLYRRKLEARVKSLNVEEAVRWIPQQTYKDMPGVYALADCVINFPSDDTFPSTLLEAAASERLIVSNPLPCYENIYLESCAVVLKDDSKTSLVKALCEVVNNDPLKYREQLRRGRALVQEKYEQVDEKKRMLALYWEMANSGGAE